MPGGDYQVQVHVIECRDLKAEDANGLSDPYARIRVLGRTKKTRVVKRVTSCVFDDVIYFDLRHTSRAAAESATIDVAILDHDTFGGHDLIGSAAFDVRAVHARPDHELYRAWVGLIDATEAGDNGYQGFLRLSVTVLGPGDEQKAHDLDAEYQRELDKEEEAAETGGVALAGPKLEGRLTFLVVYCWEAEDLPAIKSGIFTGGGVEAYVRAQVAGSEARTTAVRCRGAKLNPRFREEIWLPVTEPTEARTATVGLVDRSWGSKDRTVARVDFDLSEIPRTDRTVKLPGLLGGLLATGSYDGPRPRWHNLYGAPARSGTSKAARRANRYGARDGSTYRGRLLLSLEVLERPPRRAKTIPHVRAFTFAPKRGMAPTSAKYHFRAFAVAGSELPVFRTPGMGTAPVRLRASVGNHAIDFGFVKNEKGCCSFDAIDTLRGIDLPVLLSELPDVVLALFRGRPERAVAFARVPAAKLLREQFRGEPTWIPLTADAAARGGLGASENPGAVLVPPERRSRPRELVLRRPSRGRHTHVQEDGIQTPTLRT